MENYKPEIGDEVVFISPHKYGTYDFTGTFMVTSTSSNSRVVQIKSNDYNRFFEILSIQITKRRREELL